MSSQTPSTEISQSQPHTHTHTHAHTHTHHHPTLADFQAKAAAHQKLELSESEFETSKQAMGASMTFIDEVKERLSAQGYQKFLDILNTYYQTKSTVPQVYEQIKGLFGEGNEDLVAKFEKFLPLEVVEVRDEEEDKEKGKDGE